MYVNHIKYDEPNEKIPFLTGDGMEGEHLQLRGWEEASQRNCGLGWTLTDGRNNIRLSVVTGGKSYG